MVDIRKKGKVPVGPGQFKDAELVEVIKSDEKWNVYELDDGAQIKMKPAVVEVWRIENEYDAEGNPAYFLKMQNVMHVNSPDNLKKGVKK